MSDEGYGPSAAWVQACEEQHLRELRQIIAEHDRACVEGAECESCVAPRLARENLRLRDERDQHSRDAGTWWGDLARANDEVCRLRAIVEGREKPPSVEEIEAHAAAGGTWLVRFTGGAVGQRGGWLVEHLAWAERGDPTPLLWWPLDRDGRPTTWPVVATGGR